MRQLDETIVAITGAGRGIGAAAARRLASGGARVFICGRTTEQLEVVAADSASIVPTTVDIRDDDAVATWIDTIADQAGRLDVLINNAGVLGPKKRLDDTPVDQWRDTIDINVNGTFIVTRRAFALLDQSSRPLIINVSSSVGRRGRGQWGAYSVSKFGVEGIAEVAADELGDQGCVVTLNPGGTATDMRAKAYPDEDPETLPSPDEVGATMELLVTSLTPDQNGAKYSSRALFPVLDDQPAPEDLPADES